MRLICGDERDARREFPLYVPYPSYPDLPGFLPWCSDDNGNYYGWLTEGPSESRLVPHSEDPGAQIQVVGTAEDVRREVGQRHGAGPFRADKPRRSTRLAGRAVDAHTA